MSISINNLFSSLICLLKYSIILFCLIALPKVKSDSEINFIIKCTGCTGYNNGNWPKIFGDSFQNTKKAIVNGDSGEKKISLNYCKT